MRADTKKKHEMGKRFAIVIGVAAAGVMALGAQTACGGHVQHEADDHRGPGSRGHALIHGHVNSGGGKKCEVGRRVTLFKQRPGADRKLGVVRRSCGWTTRDWGIGGPPRAKAGWHVYATVSPKVGDGFVCSGDRSPIYTVRVIRPSKPPGCGSRAWRLGRSQAPRFFGSVLPATVPLRPPKTPCSSGLTVRAFARLDHA